MAKNVEPQAAEQLGMARVVHHEQTERVRSLAWSLQTAAPGMGFWPFTLGDLQGFGRSRRRHSVAPYFNLILLVAGRGTYRNGDQRFPLRPGSCFVSWAGLEHSFREHPEHPWHYYWMRLTGDRVETVIRSLGFRPDRRVLQVPDPAAAAAAYKRLFDYYASNEREPFQAAALLYQLLQTLPQAPPAEASDPDQALIDRASALLDYQLDTGLNVNQLAEHLRVSRQRLATAFQRRLGCSPVEHLHHVRRQRAEHLLAQTDLKISAIAQACGFASEKYFYRRFQEWTGISPGRWREQQQTESHR